MDNGHAIKLNQAPIRWALDEGRMSFFDIPAVTLWLDPSLLRILQPLREEVGDELYRLIIAYQASLGTEEDYQQMVTQLGNHFEAGFLAWGAAVSAAGWGHFEIMAFNQVARTAIVRVSNPWELQMLASQPDADAWGCPFLMGKIIGIFSHALGESCWADEKNIILEEAASSVEFHIYASDLTIADELQKLRSVRRETREKELQEKIRKYEKDKEYLRLFHSLIDKANDAIFVIDPESGRFFEVNSMAASSLGYSQEELAGMRVTDIGRMPSNMPWKECAQKIRQVGISPFETLHMRKDGSTFPVEISVNHITVKEKRFILAAARDISARKQAEENMKKSEMQYRTLFESSTDAIMVLDEAGFIDCNPSTLKMFGWASFADMSGHPSDFSPPVQPCGTDSRVLADEQIATAFKNGSHQFEWVHKRMDGSEFPAEVWLSAMQLDGKPVLQGTVRDVSARKQAEEAQRKFSSAIEQSGESIIITNKGGIIEYVNPAFVNITGYSIEEAIGQTPRILKSGNQDAHFYTAMWKRINDGHVWHGKVIDKRKDGSFFPAMLTISPITDDNNNITHYVGLHADLTEQENLEQQFHQAQKMEAIGTLVGGIAHDFNNMLAGMTGNLYLAKQRVKDDPDMLQKLTNVEQLSMHAANMIEQLLTFARKGIIRMKAMPLTPFIKETLKFLRTSTPENIAMHENICSDDLLIKGDATQLHQILMNLISNACDAVEGVEEPCISIRLEVCNPGKAFTQTHPDATAASYAHLSVEDNGCGIPQYLHEHLFEPFFTTKEQGKGTGLGLSMVYGAVTSHHGFVEMASTQNKGASFHIYLPVLEQQQADALTSSAQAEATEGHGELILLADDERCVRETTAEVLEMLGYEVVQAEDGLKALELCKDRRDDINLAMLDVVMPHCGGMQLAGKIRAIQPDLPVIFITGYDKQHVLGGEAQLPNSAILTKPVNFDDLSCHISQLLARTIHESP